LRCLTLLWAVGQGGLTNLRHGLDVWLQVFVPLLTTRGLSSYAVTYLDRQLAFHKDLTQAYGVLSYRSFFPVFDVIFKADSGVPSFLKKTLQNLYPKLETIAWGPNPETELRNFFPSFLARAEGKVYANAESVVLSSLVKCLTSDEQCFSVWQHMYMKHIKHSGELLQYLCIPGVSLPLNQRLLVDTVKGFQQTNNDLLARNHASGLPGFDITVQACSVILSKPRGLCSTLTRMIWLLLKLTVVVAIVYCAFDLYTHKGFTGTKMQIYSDKYGVTPYAINAKTWLDEKGITYSVIRFRDNAALALKNFSSWVAVNGPLYLTFISEKIDESYTLLSLKYNETVNIVSDYLKK